MGEPLSGISVAEGMGAGVGWAVAYFGLERWIRLCETEYGMYTRGVGRGRKSRVNIDIGVVRDNDTNSLGKSA